MARAKEIFGISKTPVVIACFGTSSRDAKRRELSRRVFSVRLTRWVREENGVPGSLNPRCPLAPMPSSCRSIG